MKPTRTLYQHSDRARIELDCRSRNQVIAEAHCNFSSYGVAPARLTKLATVMYHVGIAWVATLQQRLI